MIHVSLTYQKAIARVRAFVASREGLSKSGLAKRAGLSLNALRDLDKSDWSPKPDTLDKCLSAITEIRAERKSRPTVAAEAA